MTSTPIGFASSPSFLSIPKDTIQTILTELPPLSDIFPYEISASHMDNIQTDMYTLIQTIPYAILSGVYYSVHLRTWIIIEFNRFRKIAAGWKLTTEVPPFFSKKNIFIIGIHLFQDAVPTFVVTNDIKEEVMTQMQSIWPYPFVYPYTTQIKDIKEHLLDITLQSPYKIHHLRYIDNSPNSIYPNTTVRIQDIIESSCTISDFDDIHKTESENIKINIDDGRVETFRIKAGKGWDIFYLYIMGDNGTLEYYDTLYIATLEQSQYLNSRFRFVQQVTNYDWIERACFQKRDTTKIGRKCTVDNYRRLELDTWKTIQCIYCAKFQKWVMKEAVSSGRHRIVTKRDLIIN